MIKGDKYIEYLLMSLEEVIPVPIFWHVLFVDLRRVSRP